MRSFNIENGNRRKVVCVRNDSCSMMMSSYNHHMLEVGTTYTVTDVEVHSWYTLVSLEEFPGKTFNSVVFEEVA